MKTLCAEVGEQEEAMDVEVISDQLAAGMQIIMRAEVLLETKTDVGPGRAM